MNSLSIIFAFTTLFLLTQSSPTLKNTSGHDIEDGVCTNLHTENRVRYIHVDKMAFPLFTRSETVTYYGDANIFCIEAQNQKSGGTAKILEGGVGHTYVNIYLESQYSHGLEFYVSIYARNLTNSQIQVEDTILTKN